MRAALWYYNNYYIQKERGDTLAKTLEEVMAFNVSLITANQKLTIDLDKAQSDLAGWQAATWITGGITLGIIIFSGFQFFGAK